MRYVIECGVIGMEVEAIVAVKITATASSLGRKAIHRWKRPQNGKIVTAITPIAYVRSPFEPRTVIIFERQYMGAENKKIEAFVVGMHLERGFK